MTELGRPRIYRTRAKHFDERNAAVRGHLWLEGGAEPALVFRARGFLQPSYELRLRISEIQSVSDWTVTTNDGSTERFAVAFGTALESELAEAVALAPPASTATASPSPGTDKPRVKLVAPVSPEESALGSERRPLDQTPITETPQLPGFESLDTIGFSSALRRFAQAVAEDQWGYALATDGAVVFWETRWGIATDSQDDNLGLIRLPTRRLALPAKVVQLSAGVYDLLALDENGDVWSWVLPGYTTTGREDEDFEQPLKDTAVGAVAHLTSAGGTYFALSGAGEVWFWKPGVGRLGETPGNDDSEPRLLRAPVGVIELRTSARGDELIALDGAGAVWTWRYDWTWGYDRNFGADKSRRGAPARLSGLPPIRSLGGGDTAVDHDGGVWRWDEARHVSLVPGLTGVVDVVYGEVRAQGLAKGTYHALDERGGVVGWGYNNVGQVGDGTFADREKPVQVSGMNQVASLVSSRGTVYALTTSGDVYGWGGYANIYGPSIQSLYGPSPRELLLPDFTEPDGARWATLDLVSLGSQELRQAFFDFRKECTPLMQCAAAGLEDEVALMLTQSGDVDAVDDDGDTALYYAAGQGHAGIVDLLLQAGANPNIHRVTGGNSALELTATMSLPASGATYPQGKVPADYWAITLRLLRGGADPSDMYSRGIMAGRHTSQGLEMIGEEHITDYFWNDDLFPMWVNPGGRLG